MFGKLLEWILPHLYKNIFPRELDPVGFKVFKHRDFSIKSPDIRCSLPAWAGDGWGGSEIRDPR